MNGFATIGGDIYISEEKWAEIFGHVLERETNKAYATMELGGTFHLFGEVLWNHIHEEHAEACIQTDNIAYVSMVEFGNHTLEELELPAIMVCLAFEAACEDMGDALRVQNADEITRRNVPHVNPQTASILSTRIYRTAMFAQMARVWLGLEFG